MGLHQAITNRTESVPCDCGADDDHVVYTLEDSEDQLVDYDDDEVCDTLPPLKEEEDVPEGKGITSTEG
jgi:hypothetical protein